MPLKRLRYTFDYCKANPIGFLIILVLLGLQGFSNRVFHSMEMTYQIPLIIISIITTLLIYGYGLVITKDTIRNYSSETCDIANYYITRKDYK